MYVTFSTEKIRVSSDAALAWTAAHEIAHLILQHQRKADVWRYWEHQAGIILDWESRNFSTEYEAVHLGC